MKRPSRHPRRRDDEVLARLHDFNAPLAACLPDEIRRKAEKMAASPHAFFRGSAHLFYDDLADWPGSSFCNARTARTWINGDLHAGNLGSFCDAKGHRTFDINDFDESALAPYLWDLYRMATSLILLARGQSLRRSEQKRIVESFADEYLQSVVDFRGNDDETRFCLGEDDTRGVIRDLIRKSARRTRADFLDRYTKVIDGTRHFVVNDQLLATTPATAATIAAGLADWRATLLPESLPEGVAPTIRDIVFRSGAGVGSLGRHRYYVLIAPAGGHPDDDIILEIKEQRPSAVARAAPDCFPAAISRGNDGERVARSMRAAIAHPDPWLGWTRIAERPCVVREKSPYACDFNPEDLASADDFRLAAGYIARLIAKCHAAADRDRAPGIVEGSTEREIAKLTRNHHSEFQSELLAVALDRADQAELDFAAYREAANAGRPAF